MFSSMTSSFARCAVILALAGSTIAHSNMNVPTPRGGEQRDYAFEQPGNACQNGNTDIPPENVFQRGQVINPSWFWNNHDGGFVKFSMILGVQSNVDNKYFLRNENIIQGQCYTNGCEKNGFDPGNTQVCKGEPLTFPDWLEDGDYTFQWSQIGGYNSQQNPTLSLPLYHTCANVRIQGGVAKTNRPNNWIAPFAAKSKDTIKTGDRAGQPITSQDGCMFKRFDAEPADPTVVNVNNDDISEIRFGQPGGWAVAGSTLAKRLDNMILPRLGHVARALRQ